MSPDPLLMSADIARVAAERPELDEDLVQGLYQHLVLIQGRQPTIDELREYVDRLSSLDQDRLRQRLGLEPRKRSGRRGALASRSSPRTLQLAAAGPAEAIRPDRAGVTRRPGRPGWTPELFAARYQAALRRAAPPHTYQAIADQFEMLDGSVGTDPDHLRKLMKRFGQTPG
jgi:hypothetical protein